jgi:DNA-binding response OmpR family regulator
MGKDHWLKMGTPTGNNRSILHICNREKLLPLRDQILRLSGFQVDSTLSHSECLSLFKAGQYDLVLIDVEGEAGISRAEHLCSEIKTTQSEQIVAFVCNWSVAILTDCPDEIVRTEFNPEAFVSGVRDIFTKMAGRDCPDNAFQVRRRN